MYARWACALGVRAHSVEIAPGIMMPFVNLDGVSVCVRVR